MPVGSDGYRPIVSAPGPAMSSSWMHPENLVVTSDSPEHGDR